MADSYFQFPNYYAVIPAFVRYDADIPGNAKLLYGEITALSNAYGYCFAGNDYFSSLYNVDERTIKRWLLALENKGYILRIIEKDEQTGRTRRIIKICDAVISEAASSGGQKCPEGVTKMSRGGDKNVPHNNKYNIKHNNISRTREKQSNKFLNYDQRSYNMDELERALLNRARDGDSS